LGKSIKELIKLEYAKCYKDPVHFMRKYCIIQHPVRGKVNFNLYPFQEDTLWAFAQNQYNIILKGRQLGISTLVAGYSLWRMIFKKDYNVLVLATKQDVAKNLITKVRTMYDNLPSWIQKTAPHEEHNKLSLRLKNGSQIKASSTSGDAGRSEALSLLVVDEAAWIDNMDEIWTASQATLSGGGDAILLSSPAGSSGFFYKKWVEAEQEGTMNTIRLPWHVHPERDQAWRDKQSKILGEKPAAQEHDCEFLASGYTVLDGELIKWYEDTYVRDPIEKRGISGDLWIWEYPDFNKNYIVSADVSRGDGEDYSAFHVFEEETMTQVAEFKSMIGTTEFGRLLVAVATEYNNALLSIENANIGWAVVQVALDSKYTNLYYSMKEDKYIDENMHLIKGYDLANKDNLVPGFTNTTKIRPLLIAKMVEYFQGNIPIIRSKRTIYELKSFVWEKSKAQARKGYNDDLILSMCIAFWVRDTALRLRQAGIELTRKTIDGFQKPIYTPQKRIGTGWDMNIGGQQENLKWLL
jgi:hypothetical protein